MANLRTNNLCGEGGRNAYNGSVFFEGDSSYLALASGVVPSFGTGDFTIEFWINQGVNASNYTILFALTSSTASDRLEVAIHSSTIQVYTDTGAWRDTGYAPVSGVYEHIVFQRDSSGNTLKMYANGVEKWSVSNTRDYDEAWTTQIGSYGTSSYGYFEGYISNFRICKGHRVYSSNNFAPPTSALTVHYNSDGDETVLLCCQDSDDATQEATGKTITGFGRYADSSVELVPNGGPTTDVTGWTAYNSSVAYDTGQIKVTRSGGTGFSAYATITNAVAGQRYKVSAQIRSVSSRADLYVTTAVASGTLLSLSGTASATVDVSGFFTATATTLYVFTAVDGDGDIGYYNRVSVKAADYGDAPKVIPPVGVDAGNTFNGAITMNSPSWMYFPTGRTVERGRGRGLIVANYIAPANTNACEFITIQSMGNSIDFGDAAAAVRGQATFASSTRAVSGSGYVAPAAVNTIEFFTIATQSNSTDFGDVTGGNGDYTPISNQTRGIFAGGYSYPATFNAISFVTIASTGNSTDFGDMTTNRANGNRSAINSSTRGLIGGGYISPTGTNNIEFLTIATTGNSSDFGDLTSGRGNFTGLCSSTRGVFAGGSNPNNNIIDFVTIASAGNASDFGDMFTGNTVASCSTSNNTRGVIIGGDLQPADTFTNTMQFVTIATTGDTQDFGDMLTVGAYRNATSDSHGGIS
jgi:hypothetical protein